MAFSKPYPPDPITYTQYNAIVDALETRYGPGAVGEISDITKIINSRGNIWDFVPGNVQLAINDIHDNGVGGHIILPKGKVTETSQWNLDEVYPIHIFGRGACWHGHEDGTMVEFNLANGIHCIELDAGAASHFGGIYDMGLYPIAGNRDVIYLDRMSDYHIERVYINAAKRHGINVENTGDTWNLWIKDSLIENCIADGIRFNGGAGAGVILKSYVLNNYFYANAIDIEIGALDGVIGKVRLCQFHNNQHFNTSGIGMKLYRRCEHIIVNGAIFYSTGGDAIDIDDDGAANKNKRINLIGGHITGNAITPNGIDVGGYAENVIIDDYQIEGVTNVNINKGANVSNLLKGHNILEGEDLPIPSMHGSMRILAAAPVTITIDIISAWHLIADMTSGHLDDVSFEAGQAGTIAAVADGGGGKINVQTTLAHNLAEGDYVSLTNTTDYDGIHQVTDIVDGTHFKIVEVWNVNRTGGWAQGSSLSPDEAALIEGSAYLSALPAGANKVYSLGLFKNGVLEGAWQQSRKFAAADEGNIAMGGLSHPSAGDIFQLGVLNETDATNIQFTHLNFSIRVV